MWKSFLLPVTLLEGRAQPWTQSLVSEETPLREKDSVFWAKCQTVEGSGRGQFYKNTARQRKRGRDEKWEDTEGRGKQRQQRGRTGFWFQRVKILICERNSGGISPAWLTCALMHIGCTQETRRDFLEISVVSDSVTSRTVAHQAPLSVRSSKQEYWNGLSCSPNSGTRTHVSCLLPCRRVLYH